LENLEDLLCGTSVTDGVKLQLLLEHIDWLEKLLARHHDGRFRPKTGTCRHVFELVKALRMDFDFRRIV